MQGRSLLCGSHLINALAAAGASLCHASRQAVAVPSDRNESARSRVRRGRVMRRDGRHQRQLEYILATSGQRK
jgi:hypothetical protein